MLYNKYSKLRMRFSYFHYGKIAWSIARLVIIIGLGYVFLFPVLYMISVAFRSPDSVNDPSIIWIPRSLSLASIKDTIDFMDYKNALVRTLVISISSTACMIMSCAFVGYGFARFDFAEKKIAFMMVIITIIVPSQMTLISSYTNYRHFTFFGVLKLLSFIPGIPDSINLLNTPFTFILPSVFSLGLRGGLFIFIYRSFFSGMPKELEEAACIDGCGPIGTYFKVMFPLAKSAIIVVLLFSFVWHWNDITLSSMYYMNNMPLSVKLNNLQSLITDTGTKILSKDTIRTYMQSGCLLTISPLLILFIFAQKQFAESVERSGIVG